MRVNQKAQERQNQLELTRLATPSRLKISQRNFWVLIIGILLLGSVLAFLARNKYLLKKQEAKELAFQNSQKNLPYAKNHLNRLIGRIRDDQQIISRFQEENNTKENHDLLGQLRVCYEIKRCTEVLKCERNRRSNLVLFQGVNDANSLSYFRNSQRRKRAKEQV